MSLSPEIELRLKYMKACEDFLKGKITLKDLEEKPEYQELVRIMYNV